MVAHYSRIKSLKWHLIKLISCSNLSVIDYRYLYHNLRRCSNKSLSLWMGIPTLKATAFFLFLVTVRTYFNIGPKTQIGQNWGSAGSMFFYSVAEVVRNPEGVKSCSTMVGPICTSMAFMFITKSLVFQASRLIYVPDTDLVQIPNLCSMKRLTRPAI